MWKSGVKYVFLGLLATFDSINLLGQNRYELWEIQGTENSSPLNEEDVFTRDNVVSAVGNGFFFIQSTPSNKDQDLLTSNGLMVFASNNLIPNVGDIVNVGGSIREDDGNTVLLMDEIQVVGNSDSLFEFRVLNDAFPSGLNLPIHDLETVENTLVSFEDIWIASPSDSEGQFIVSAKAERPAREPGVEFPAPLGFLEWDGNNEIMEMIPHALGGSRELNVFSGSKISGTGVIVQSDSRYQLWPLEYVIEERSFPAPPPKLATELSIACLNVLRFFDSDFNYGRRLEKLSEHIVDVMDAPDIIAFQEMGGRNEMEDIIEAVNQIDPSIDYTLWIFESTADINNAYLTRKTISNIEVEQLAVFETLTIGGRKHDRPPLLLNAEINTPDKQNISILNLHIRSLNGIEGETSDFVRTKRHEQAVSIAEIVKSLQLQNRNLLVVGDFNAFPFSDGYVDVVNQIRGTESLGAEFEVVPSNVDPPLRNISVDFTDPSERYSFVFRGNIQILDQCLSGELEGMEVSGFHYIRGNADSPELNLVNINNGFRISDHDGFLVYLEVGSQPEEMESFPELVEEIGYPNPFQSQDEIRFNLEAKDNLTISLYNVAGQLIEEIQLVAFDIGSIRLESVASIPAGVYFLNVEGRSFSHLGKIFVVN